MPDLVKFVPFRRDWRPDDSAWMRKAASDFTTIATRWGAIDTWSAVGVRVRDRKWKLDARLVPPPDDTAWERFAQTLFAAIAARWGGIDEWDRAGVRTREKRFILDPRRVPPPIDDPWEQFAASLFNTIASRWAAIDTWTLARRTPERQPRPFPFQPIPFDDFSWIGGLPRSVFDGTQFPAIDDWVRSVRSWRAQSYYLLGGSGPSSGGPLPAFDPTLWPSIDSWSQAATLRERAGRFVGWVPDDAWIEFAAPPPAVFTISMFAGVDAWLQASRVWRRQGIILPGGSGPSSGGPAPTVPPYDGSQWAAIDSWLQAFRVKRRPWYHPAYYFWVWPVTVPIIPFDAGWLSAINTWTDAKTTSRAIPRSPVWAWRPDDAAWLRFIATFVPYSDAMFAAIQDWLQVCRTSAQIQRSPSYVWSPDDSAWAFRAGAFPFSLEMFAAVQDWSQTTMTRAGRRLDTRLIAPPTDEWMATIPVPPAVRQLVLYNWKFSRGSS